MAISTHAELKSAVQRWLNNSGATFAGDLDNMIILAEARLNRELRLQALEKTVTGTAAASIALPSDFLELRRLSITSGGSKRTLSSSGTADAQGYTGSPTSFVISGNAIVMSPAPSGQTYELTYCSKIPALSVGTNWLIENAPNVYLYAALVEAAAYLNHASSQQFVALYQDALTALRNSDEKQRYGGPLQMRSRYTV